MSVYVCNTEEIVGGRLLLENSFSQLSQVKRWDAVWTKKNYIKE